MQTRNELDFLVSSKYHCSEFNVPPKETQVSSKSSTLASLELSTLPNEVMGSSLSSHKQREKHRSYNGPNLLTIPLEIRLHIYHYVLLTHPIHHAHLAPLTPQPNFSGLNTEEFHTTMIRSHGGSSSSSSTKTEIEITTRTLITNCKSPISKTTSEFQATYISTPLPSSCQNAQAPRIQGKVPTALLASCKQIYSETSHLPWHHNTFSFINWFWSGVYAARSFTGHLPAWQRDSLRNVAIEVLGRDLWVGGLERGGGIAGGIGKGKGSSSTGGVGGKEGKGVGQWRELCGFWGGVQSLKMVVKGGLFVDALAPGGGGISNSDSPAQTQIQGTSGICILNTDCEWVSHGLLAMSSLRTLELEIEDKDVSCEVKTGFCAALEGALNSEERKTGRRDDWIGDTRVVFVERVKIVPKEKFVYYGGEPGDESVWSEEM